MGDLVAVLIADPQAGLPAELVDAVASAARAEPNVLAPNEAIEFALPNGDDWNAILGTVIGPRELDLAIVPAENRRKRLLIADMDSTIIEQECIDELADEVGKRDEVAAVTERAMRGEIDFERALRDRVATLRGLDVGAVDRVLRDRIHIRSGARELVATMRANGAHTMLVSGGFTHFTEAIADAVGFSEHLANRLNVDGDHFDGTVVEPILGREAKLTALTEAAAQRGLGTDDVLAIGDGANDLAMIEAAGLGMAIHAKPAVAAKADVSVRFAGLRAALFVQGYRADEIVRH